MGSSQAIGMMEAVSQGSLKLEQAVSWHLQSNHYPAVPLRMVPICMEAISLANSEDWNEMIALPAGVSFRGRDEASVSEIVKGYHLDSFICDFAEEQAEEEEGEEEEGEEG